MITKHPYYGIEINTNSAKFKKITKSLLEEYAKLPNTKCLFCPNKCGVEADCCKVFSPPMLLIEFLNIMTTIETWEQEKQAQLIHSCLQSFLNPENIKPCVLLKNTLCSIYNTRPLACRLFGLYEDKEYEDRLEKIFNKKIPENTPFTKQCKNLEVEGEENFVPKTKSDAIFENIHKLDINLFEDKKNGEEIVMSSCTYMPFDAHYLCFMYGPDFLEQLTSMKIDLRNLKNMSEESRDATLRLKFVEKERNVQEFLENFRKLLNIKS